jgi:hypothetical membrane protein
MRSRQVRLALIAESGCALFIITMTTFHFIQPELHPFERFGSEYAVGRLGWMMNVAFLGFASALAALSVALGRALEPPMRSRKGAILFAFAALGVLGSGLFNADLQGEAVTRHGIAHSLAGLVAFLSMLPGMVIVSRRLYRVNVLRGGYRILLPLSWANVGMFLAMLFLFEPFGLVGLGQRVFLIGIFAWLLTAAEGIRSEQFSSAHERSRMVPQ